MYKSIFKRFFDFVAAFVAFANSGKIVFKQPRPGKNGKIFNVIKFKTMNDKRDERGNLLPDGERITAVGRFVRSLSIDELPQVNGRNAISWEQKFEYNV